MLIYQEYVGLSGGCHEIKSLHIDRICHYDIIFRFQISKILT